MTDGPEPLTELTTADLVAIFARTEGAMRAHGPGLDAMNVFPVADSDTGSNLVVVAAALAGAAAGSSNAAALASSLVAAAHGSAPGCAGAMFAAFVVGFADDIRNADRIDADRFALGLEAGAERARQSVAGPRDGTMLSVIDAASDAALAALDAGSSLAEMVGVATEAGLDALERTPEQLEVLADAGVVDAGAAGWLVWLDVVHSHIVGDDGSAADEWEAVEDGGSSGARWEVRFRIDCDAGAAECLAGVLASLGDVASFERNAPAPTEPTADGDPDVAAGRDPGATDSWEVAVGVDDIGAVIEAALSAGRPRDIRVDGTAAAGRP